MTDLERLSRADFKEALALLPKIEESGQNVPGSSLGLISFLHHSDYLIRSRVFIALGRMKDKEMVEPLIDYINGAEEEWQLRALECLYLLKDTQVAPQIAPFLLWHHRPLLARGTYWLLGFLGGEEALELMIQFAISPEGRLVKSDIIYEGLSMALQSLGQGESYWRKMLNENPAAARYFHYSRLPEVEHPRFHVYPYPDYLLDQALSHGIKAKVFKRLYYRQQVS
ncbi:HEAT repeat domain-containing protein [Dehalobacterium formicoaceticum]|uniref:HEAT repeat domain-containing protein n=1 Tax=Dehalobacterium formicoaceticum TaxID=51515 RepID=A0ABT1Y5J2_9FIRM|nr:hypothetical protein [Dehalobacterium formicoaceticum]MCR6545395.1 hypothetical protein [Dehalobacterium formicoaceticum]